MHELGGEGGGYGIQVRKGEGKDILGEISYLC